LPHFAAQMAAKRQRRATKGRQIAANGGQWQKIAASSGQWRQKGSEGRRNRSEMRQIAANPNNKII